MSVSLRSAFCIYPLQSVMASTTTRATVSELRRRPAKASLCVYCLMNSWANIQQLMVGCPAQTKGGGGWGGKATGSKQSRK